MVILDDTWAANGGSEDDWSAGFDLAEDLAAEPQFASAVNMGGPDAEGPNWCSGTWLGNDANDHAYVLTAAHCFQFEGGDGGHRIFRTDGGTERFEVARTFHPRYDPNDGDGSGYYDMAVIELDGPIEDLGDAPVLYSGSDEGGAVQHAGRIRRERDRPLRPGSKVQRRLRQARPGRGVDGATNRCLVGAPA